MKRTLTTAALVIAATTLAAVSASAEILPGAIPTRAEYVAEVEPICEENTNANKPILKAARQKVNAKNAEGRAAPDFFKVSDNFGKALKSIEAVPRPTEDSARLEKWFSFLKTVQTNLRKVGKALKEENKVRASHEKIRAERSSNAANNVSFVFGFHYCRLTPAQFSSTGALSSRCSAPVLVVSAAAAPPARTRRTRPRGEDAGDRRQGVGARHVALGPAARARPRGSPRRPSPAWRRSSGSALSRAARSPGSPRWR